MSSRIVDLKNLESIEVGLAIIGKIINDLEILIERYSYYIDTNESLNNWLNELKIVYHKYNGIENSYFKILNNIYSKLMKKQIERDFSRCFEIEDKVSKIVAIIWNKQMSDPNTFVNGDDFKFLVHATRGLKEQNGNSYMCCSMITNNHIVTAYSKLCLILNVDDNNFICANGDDCATTICKKNNVRSLDKIKCVNNYNEQLLLTYNCTKNNPITKIVLPSEIEKFSVDNVYNNVSKKYHNEIILNDYNLEIKAILLISNGCDLLFDEYKEALKIKEIYNVDIKVINKSLYRRKNGLSAFLEDDIVLWNQLLDKYNSSCALNFFRNMNNEEISEFLDKYYNDIVVPGEYDTNIRKEIDDVIENLKCLTKQY